MLLALLDRFPGYRLADLRAESTALLRLWAFDLAVRKVRTDG